MLKPGDIVKSKSGFIHSPSAVGKVGVVVNNKLRDYGVWVYECEVMFPGETIRVYAHELEIVEDA